MQNVDRTDKLHGVDCSVGIAVIVLNDFQNASTTKALQGLDARMLFAMLRVVQRLAHDAAPRFGKSAHIAERRADPIKGFGRTVIFHILIIP